MTGRNNIPRSFITRLFIGLFSAAVLLPGLQLSARTMSKIELAQQELARIRKIRQLAKSGKYTVQEVFVESYRTVAIGCRNDYSRNLRIAENYLEKAQEAEKYHKEKTAKQCYAGVQLFKYCALQNKKVVDAFKKKDASAIAQACKEIPKVEAKILQVLGVTVKRNWLTPQELEKLATILAAGGGGQQ